MAPPPSDHAVAAAILPLVGGPANVSSVAHCMTRLRLELRDRSVVRDGELRALPGVLGVVEGDAYQIVLGPGRVTRVAAEFTTLLTQATDPDPDPPPDQSQDRTRGQSHDQGRDQDRSRDRNAGQDGEREREQEPAPVGSRPGGADTPGGPGRPGTGSSGTDPSGTTGPSGTGPSEPAGAPGARLKAAQRARNATPVKLLLRRIAGVFVPLIPALIGCGILAGLNGILLNLGVLPGLTPVLTALSGGFMTLLPVFVGWSAAREFGGTPVLGGVVGSIVVFPGVERIEVFGQRLSPGQGGVLGALAAAVLAVYVEKACRRRLPDVLDVLVTPALTVLVAGLATVYGLMFAAGAVAGAIGDLANALLSGGGAVAGFVLGGLFLPLVMLGLHQALIPIHATLIEQYGHTALLPILAMAGAGQVGAAVAVYLRLPQDRRLRATIRSALPAGLLGVGEPLIYGVSLPLGRPFATACVGGAFGGAFIGLFHTLGQPVGATAIGPSGWALFPLLHGGRSPLAAVAVYAGGLLTGYAAGFLVTYCFGLRGIGPDGTPRRPAEREAPALQADHPRPEIGHVQQ
ncbi:PTS transporter subunit EIIC [Streptomyces yaizuensis]|uniref:PTS transporter subunit EIIC n=1 Tax=Streptomyces yaizuensis TaxID=2989713 RepID=A0ABQ5P3G4_9ACTN|nr:PTS transporter subunit EIIC [Streptomyces sp. YSPA8]GLF97151.1 PTS transporter subunit EIIC [Streptomyces sp. YSPA8]